MAPARLVRSRLTKFLHLSPGPPRNEQRLGDDGPQDQGVERTIYELLTKATPVPHAERELKRPQGLSTSVDRRADVSDEFEPFVEPTGQLGRPRDPERV